MTIPYEPIISGIPVNVHLVMECLAFAIAFRYYKFLKYTQGDPIRSNNRLSIMLGAIAGAFAGSRLMGFLEHPVFSLNPDQLRMLLDSKSIMGGLFGGLLGVEAAKKIIGEQQSSGDLFTFPLILGIFIGRIGCFLSGIKEFTYGTETDFFMGMDLGDGILRHPTSLYELLFLIVLFVILYTFRNKLGKQSGLLFKLFMLSYFGFRFFIELVKPNVFYTLGLSSIQWLCLICWIYYLPTLKKLLWYAYQKIYVLRLHA